MKIKKTIISGQRNMKVWNKMKKVCLMAMMIVAITPTPEVTAQVIPEINTVVIDSRKLTHKMLVTRKKKHIMYIEVCKGTVKNKKKDGKLSDGSYISYKKVKGCHKGDKIMTYCVYNPFTNYDDDIIERWDFVTDCKHKGGRK